MDKILEQDLEPLAPEPEKPAIPLDDVDLEEITGGEEEGGADYQYTLTVKQQEDAEGDKSLEPDFTYILTPKEEEGEETEDDLESIEDTSTGIENAQAPQASVAPAAPALPESVWHDLEPLTEQGEAPIGPAGPADGQVPPPAPPAAVPPAGETPTEEEPELEEANVELSQEDLKSFIEGSEIELTFSIDEETEFTLDEAIDYLKLYPDTEVFVKVKGDIDEFKEKLDDFVADKEGGAAETGTEEQNVMVDNEGETLDMKNTPSNPPASPSAVPKESFSVFNFRGKKNLPDGIYIGHLAENKLYGRIDLKLTPGTLVIGKEVFALEEKLNITEAKEKESIELLLKSDDVCNLISVLQEKADIVVKL